MYATPQRPYQLPSASWWRTSQATPRASPGDRGRQAVRRQRFQHAPGDIGAGRVEHGVVVGERHLAQKIPVVVGVEGRPAAVARLHGQQPVPARAAGRPSRAGRRMPAPRSSASIAMAVSSISG